ncbi:MAG TPA: hypothetical protein VI636_16445 [Candidatus Angelobacter sp.]
MYQKSSLAVVFLLSILAVGQNSGSTANQAIKRAQEEQFQVRRQHFETGRQLLLDKGVPFDPDELLREGWSKNLKAQLDSMPEMQQSRYEAAPLTGAYVADTLYLPENVHLSGDTIIVVNYLVFEGKNVVVKGPHDLHVFPAKPVTVLGTTLAELLLRKSKALDVALSRGPDLPSLQLIRDVVPQETHHITFDTSGISSTVVRKPKPTSSFQTAAWDGILLSAFQSGNRNVSGESGAPGQNGAPGATGAAGTNSLRAANGSCPTQLGGAAGEVGGQGGPGTEGGNAAPGGVGQNAGVIDITVPDTDINAYDYIADGGNGGPGGIGGDGGQGGPGGIGGIGGNGVACGCDVGLGGDAGEGGAGGTGGPAGQGGNGGNGGNGGPITVSLPWNSTGPGRVSNRGGTGGTAGLGGIGGVGGSGGLPGTPGNGATACGQAAPNGNSKSPGPGGAGGAAGKAGAANGQNGANGPTPSIAYRPNPNGGGGGGGDPCLGSGGGGFQPGSGNTPDPECSPILIDTEGEGFHLTSALTGVTFDISGTGHSVQMAWTDGHYHNAFLALPGADGLVHDGKQLFGNFTPQPQSSHPNGFIALAQYDKPENGGNGDGIIDERDQVYSQLRLWIDENHDGVCQPNELHRLPELGVYSLALKYVESRRKDEWGNQFRYKAQVNPGDRKDARDQTQSGDPGRWTYDVFLAVK